MLLIKLRNCIIPFNHSYRFVIELVKDDTSIVVQESESLLLSVDDTSLEEVSDDESVSDSFVDASLSDADSAVDTSLSDADSVVDTSLSVADSDVDTSLSDADSVVDTSLSVDDSSADTSDVDSSLDASV